MELVYKNEKALFGLMLAVSVAGWVLLLAVTFGSAILYGLLFFVGYCFAQSALVSTIKGTAVHITGGQFPDLQRQVMECCAKLGLEEVPDAYLMQMGGVLNAFAVRFLGRHFIVLYSEVVDALEDNPDALNFYIGHEIGHIKRKHLSWSAFLLPASVLPLLGAAYARAREYTCDRHGLAACAHPANAQLGLAALAAGGKRWRTLDQGAYLAQAQHSDGFWMSFHELVGDYPWLVKRMGALKALAEGQEASHPSRHPGAVALALLVPRFGVGGGAGLLLAVAAIGVLAALAVPAYQDYQQKAQVADAYRTGKQAAAVVEKYYYENKAVPSSLGEVGLAPRPVSPGVEQLRLDPVTGVVEVLTRIASPNGPGLLVFTPSLGEDKRLVWTCSASELAPTVLPPGCR